MSFSDWSGAASTYLDYFKPNQDRLRRELLDPFLLNALNPRGKSILDIGCGEGYFSRVMKAAGAKHVVGIDISPELIESARQQDPSAEYEVYDMVSTPVLWPNIFDGAVAHMVMMDVSDIDTAYQKIAASLVPSGRFVLSIANPYYAWPVGRWRLAPSGDHRQLVVTNYFVSRMVQKLVGNGLVPHYHRPLSEYINIAAKHGLILSSYLEPATTPELNQRFAGSALANIQNRLPIFLVLQFDKSAREF